MDTAETYDKKSYDKKSRSSIFDLWTLELSNFDLNIGFLVENCIYKQPKHKKFPDPRTENWNFLSYVSTVGPRKELIRVMKGLCLMFMSNFWIQRLRFMLKLKSLVAIIARGH